MPKPLASSIRRPANTWNSTPTCPPTWRELLSIWKTSDQRLATSGRKRSAYMEMKKAGKVHYLEPGIFAAAGAACQGFTTRHEGVSRQPYNSLNLGAATFDSPHNVQGNRSILARVFGA